MYKTKRFGIPEIKLNFQNINLYLKKTGHGIFFDRLEIQKFWTLAVCALKLDIFIKA